MNQPRKKSKKPDWLSKEAIRNGSSLLQEKKGKPDKLKKSIGNKTGVISGFSVNNPQKKSYLSFTKPQSQDKGSVFKTTKQKGDLTSLTNWKVKEKRKRLKSGHSLRKDTAPDLPSGKLINQKPSSLALGSFNFFLKNSTSGSSRADLRSKLPGPPSPPHDISASHLPSPTIPQSSVAQYGVVYPWQSRSAYMSDIKALEDLK